eukprot:RCo012656
MSRDRARALLQRLPDHVCLALENHVVLLSNLDFVETFRKRLRRVLESSSEVGDAVRRIFKLFDHFNVDIRNEQEKAERREAELRKTEKRLRQPAKSAFLDLGAEEGSESEDEHQEQEERKRPKR